MQNTSGLYDNIVSSENHWFEVSLAIGEGGRLQNELRETLLFGGLAILVDTGGPTTGYREEQLFSLKTTHKVFKGNTPTVGGAISGEIDIELIAPQATIPKMARLVPYVRATDGENTSEWIQKGVFWIDTREKSHNGSGIDILTIHGYDSMLLFDDDYPSDSEHDYPITDIDIVRHMANHVGVGVDNRTVQRMNKGYTYPLPIGYSMRELLCAVAASYAGNFVMSDENELLLITLGDLPPETNYLLDQVGNVLVFGDDKILV